MFVRSNVRGWVRWAVMAGLVTAALDRPLPAETPAAPAAVKPAQAPSPAEGRLRSDVSFLADDAREGRAPGTQGIETSAAYIAGVFQGAGLKTAPGADGYFQTFKIGGEARLGKAAALNFDGPEGKTVAAEKADFSPLAIGTGGSLKKVPVVFAGYGITAKDEERKVDYDDYAGVDVKGKAVLIVRREPRRDRDKSPFADKKPSDFATFRHKATNAYQHGAAAVLLVNDRGGAKEGRDPLMALNMAGGDRNSAIPFVMITRALADKVLAGSGEPALADLEAQIDEDLKPRTREIKGWTLTAEVDIQRTSVETRNVVGVLEGAGPLAEETVVVGAHYDHLGKGGGLFSGSLAPFSRDIHNGADDNASGTAMVMELARRMARRVDAPPRRVVFMAFSGEERGLLGSKHYVENPLIPLKDTVMMVNLDMVGRLNDKDELTMIGTGTVPGLDALVAALGSSAGLKIKTTSVMNEGFGGSDHQSFYDKGIPVLFAFTGIHRDYHRPSDDANLINYAGMARIADYLELILLDLARRPGRPTFTKLAPSRLRQSGGGDPARASFSVYLGTMPDYGAEVKGVKLSGVREGSPAEKGGMKGGDVIVKFGGKPVSTLYDYMESMSRYKPDDTVEIVVERDGKETTLSVKLGRKPSE